MTQPEQRILLCRDKEAWEAWLTFQHATAKDVWLILGKARSQQKHIRLEDAIAVALCFGWIDGKLKSLDSQRYLLRFSPRKQSSRWSRINRERAVMLIQEGKMRDPGYAKINEALSNGAWENAYTSRVCPEIPEDLHAALEMDFAARSNFEAWSNSTKVQATQWVNEAKRAATRQQRIQRIVSSAKANIKFPGSIECLMSQRIGGDPMDDLQTSIREYTALLATGTIQRAYKGIMETMASIKSQLETMHPESNASALYLGYMDMTYFALTPPSLKEKKLKIAIVYLHDSMRFEAWLCGANRSIQRMYHDLFQTSDLGEYTLSPLLPGVDSIIASVLLLDPDFNDPDTLKKKLIRQIDGFTNEMLRLLNLPEPSGSNFKKMVE